MKHLLRISIVLVLVVMTQSCSTYKRPVSFDEAVVNTPTGVVKIHMNNGAVRTYLNIVEDDGKYYGIRTVNGSYESVLLEREEIEGIRYRNKKSSVFYNWTGIGIVVGIISLGSAMMIF